LVKPIACRGRILRPRSSGSVAAVVPIGYLDDFQVIARLLLLATLHVANSAAGQLARTGIIESREKRIGCKHGISAMIVQTRSLAERLG
jgi:hypothetical protein